MSFRYRTLAVTLGAILVCVSGFPTSAKDVPPQNWNNSDAPCAKYDDLRNLVLRDIGVRIDVAGPWATAFRRAFSLWNIVLNADFHEVHDLDACGVRIVNGSSAILSRTIVARSQVMEWTNFRGKIAVSPAQLEN